MKKLFFASVLLLYSVAYAGPVPSNPNLDPEIACVSIGIDASGNPLQDPTRFELQFKPLKNYGDPATNKYSITVKTQRSGQPPTSETSLAMLDFYQKEEGWDFIAWMGPNFDGDTGRFTSRSIYTYSLGPYEPYIVYGWSTNPMTVNKLAVEYRCQTQQYY